MKKDFLVQLYVIFNCLIDLGYIRREESKIKGFFPLELQIHTIVHPSKGPLCMDTHGRLCVLGLPKRQVNPELRVVLSEAMHSPRAVESSTRRRSRWERWILRWRYSSRVRLEGKTNA